MGIVVNFPEVRPPARYDEVPWSDARIEEASDSAGPFSTIDTITFGTPDSDPTRPQSRSFTTVNGTGLAKWYRVVFLDGAAGESEPTTPTLNGGGNSYVDLEAFLDTVDQADGSDAFLADARRSILAASQGIELICGRWFWKTPEQTRYYTPVSPALVVVDDTVSITELATDQNFDGTFEQVWTASTDYVLTPLNAALDGWPFTRIEIANGWRPIIGLPSWSNRSVKVTGIFGWPAVPVDVEEAVTILAARLVKRKREVPLGFQIDAGAAMRMARTDPDVMTLIGPLSRESLY